MSHILLKKVQDNLISAPASNYIKIFSNDNDGGLLYYMDSSGVPTSIADSVSTYNPVISITYSSLYSLYNTGGFATGSYYYISDFESYYDQPDYYFDGTLKTSLETKGKPAIPVQPIIVMATSKNTLCPDAYQPYYPNDKIKYDITWNATETNGNAKGRISERIDSQGNRTDYDHRTIRFKRYQRYSRQTQLSGTITSFNCTTGAVTGSGTSFSSLSTGDVIILDTDINHGGDINYTVALMVRTVSSNSSMVVEVDSLYNGSLPPTITLNNGSQIVPVDYSFTLKNYTFWSSNSESVFDSYKEFYFSQSDQGDFDDEVFTFQSTGYGSGIYHGIINNYIGNYSNNYLNLGNNNELILSNNVFIGGHIFNNNITGLFYNNTLSNNFENNNISNNFYNNNIFNDFRNNNIDSYDFSDNSISGEFKYNSILGYRFQSNILKDIRSNSINCTFNNNIIDNNFGFNIIKCDSFSYNIFGEDAQYNNIEASFDSCTLVSGFINNHIKGGPSLSSINFSSSTIVYGNYSKTIFYTAAGSFKISYYDASNTLVADDVDA